MCSEAMRLMHRQMIGYPIDVFLAKNSDVGVSVTRGISDGSLSPVSQQLNALKTMTRASGRCNPEHAMAEFQRFMSLPDYTEMTMHWFIDAETFLSFVSVHSSFSSDHSDFQDPSIVMRRFPTLTIYVLGELRTLHDGGEKTKKICATWTKEIGATVRFLMCGADFDGLKAEILNEERIVMWENSVECLLLSEKFEIQVSFSFFFFFSSQYFKILFQLLGRGKFHSAAWPCDAVVVIGFISDIELSRMSVVGQQKNVDDVFNVSTKSEMGNEMLWSLAEYMMGDVKQPMSCLCACLHDGDIFEYALLVADVEGEISRIKGK